jgi:sigma-B regulation protein RsbU (phosphoserine phosphatase)
MIAKGKSKENEIKSLVDENRRLHKAIEELSMLNDLAKTICSAMRLNEILDRVVKNSIKILRVEQGAIFLVSENSTAPLKTLIRRGDTDEGKKPYRLGVGLSGWLIKHQKPLMIQDIKTDGRFRTYTGETEEIKSVLGVPLISRGKLTGVIILFNKLDNQPFTMDDQRMLSIIASQSAQVIENARLFMQEIELRRLEQDLEMAQEIQMRLLPKESPQIDGFDLAGISYPAREVGGDYFDFIEIDRNHWGVALGDVSGKGIPAALLMSNLQATLRGQALTISSIKDCIAKANYLLYLNTDSEKFVTLFYGVLDCTRKLFHYVNAGHNYPFYLDQEGEFRALEIGGLAMGIIPDSTYEEGQIQLHPGEIIVIYSDGVTEADNELEEMFGDKRLQEIVRQNKDSNSRQIIDKIYQGVREFIVPKMQEDDITLVVIKAV